MLRVTHPDSFAAERRWALQFILGDVLGIEFAAQTDTGRTTRLQLDGRTLELADVFFPLHAPIWCVRINLPDLPLKQWPHHIVGDAPTPILFGDDWFAHRDKHVNLGLDIIGSVFFLLSRYEEIASPTADEHDRFPASASFALKAGFLDRPLTDEYVEILWHSMRALWPRLERKSGQGRIIVSCDVDHPYDASARHFLTTARAALADIGKRHNPSLALKRVLNFACSRRGHHGYDPFNTFDWYMDRCEENGHRAVFYFIAGHSGGAIDGNYNLDEPYLQRLLQRIAKRGHEIGVHGSYNTYCDANQAIRERQTLIRACENAGVNANVTRNRQHYLRWNTAHTPDVLEAAGYDDDSTGSFADHPGFRYGTAHTFHMWSWQQNKPLRLRQVPLILMESSVIAERYLGLGYSETALKLIQTLKQRALRNGGNFALLWHNSHFIDRHDRTFFDSAIIKK